MYNVEISEEDGVRYLHFGSEWVQGAMRIRKPHALELAYTREMMVSLLLHPNPIDFLLIGLGAGSQAKFLLRYLPDARIRVVEINPRVIDVAREFFRLPEDPRRLRIKVGDGVAYVRQTRERYDIILVDGFDRHARAGALDTLPFYQACRAVLKPHGVMATNLFGSSPNFPRSLSNIGAAFDARMLVLPPCTGGNVVAFGLNTELDHCTLLARAKALKQASRLDLTASVQALRGPSEAIKLR